jgi:riboflavin biosynthesis pyrimidine reductase
MSAGRKIRKRRNRRSNLELDRIVQLLKAENLTAGLSTDLEIQTVHASDLISEVLVSCGRGAMLLTSLLDAQIVNTAELFDLSCVVFVGSRRPSQSIIDAAVEDEIPVFVTGFSMFEACGLLYQHGLKKASRY